MNIKSKVTFSNAPSPKPQQSQQRSSVATTPLMSERRRRVLRDTNADWAELIKMQTEHEDDKGKEIPEMVESARIMFE